MRPFTRHGIPLSASTLLSEWTMMLSNTTCICSGGRVTHSLSLTLPPVNKKLHLSVGVKTLLVQEGKYCTCDNMHWRQNVSYYHIIIDWLCLTNQGSLLGIKVWMQYLDHIKGMLNGYGRPLFHSLAAHEVFGSCSSIGPCTPEQPQECALHSSHIMQCRYAEQGKPKSLVELCSCIVCDE